MTLKWSETGSDWFLRRVLQRLVRKFHDRVYLERLIPKSRLYSWMGWWFRCTREDTRQVLTVLAKRYSGIQFSNQGLRIPRQYLDARNWESQADIAPSSAPPASSPEQKT